MLEVTTLPQVSTYVVTNEVDAGFVNLSAAPLTNRSQTIETQSFLNFLNTEQARSILKRHGL